MTQAIPLVLRIPREDLNTQHILVNVEKVGSRPLDIKLTATDSDDVYVVSLKHNQTSELKTKNSRIPQEQWENLLSFVFLERLPEGVDISITEDLEAVAIVRTVKKGKTEVKSVVITLQKRIEGITQKLGEITLPEGDDEISLFEWCGIAIESKNAIKQELEALRAVLRSKDDHIKRVDDSLAELTQLKCQSEDQLLEKFCLLLNEKKLKIRDQQRLLASSSVDPTKLAEVEGSRAGTRERSAGPSRARKRKAGAAQVESEEESDGGYEKMEIDVPVEDSEREEEQTASETESESDAPPVSPPTRKTRGTSAQPPDRAKSSPKAQAPPPKRDLPFAKKPPPEADPQPADGSETESDDEL